MTKGLPTTHSPSIAAISSSVGLGLTQMSQKVTPSLNYSQNLFHFQIKEKTRKGSFNSFKMEPKRI